MRRFAILIATVALAASACSSTLGRSIPECDTTSATMVLAVQSVPGSGYVSCVVGLFAGWEFNDLKAESGRSSYTLDSDRMGTEFLNVRNVLGCDVSGATLADSPGGDIDLWKDVVSETTVEIVVVPEGLTTETSGRTLEIVRALEEAEVKGKQVVVTPSLDDGSTSERIREASADGAHVIIISIRDAEEGTLTVVLEGSTEEIEVDSFDEAMDTIEAVESESQYSGNWYYVFKGGCVVYTFDAEGSGVASIESDVESALGLYDAEQLRQVARDQGYRIP